MGRIPRHRLGQGVFHVVNRALDARFVFEDDVDKAEFLRFLGEGAAKHTVTVYHWVIMSNHFHLAAEVLKTAELSAFVGQACRRYSMFYHRRHGGSGPLWSRRFKSILVQKQGYLNRLGRYIERNPVRAGLVDDPGDYAWSSATAYLTGEDDVLIRPADSWMYRQMGGDVAECAASYRQYLMSSEEREADEELFGRRKMVIGDDRFCANTRLQFGRATARRVGRPRDPRSS